MSTKDRILIMLQELKSSSFTHEQAVASLERYTNLLTSLDFPETRRLREELPDLQRLLNKGHDAILKGRLQDALLVLQKGIAQSGPADTEPSPIDTPEEAPRKHRNIPNLGMS